MRPLAAALTLAAALLAAAAPVAAAEYKGFRVCTKCHDAQGDSWRMTAHAKAFESLRPSARAAAKSKAGLDPAKDYTQDRNCVGCHVTGLDEPGGYRIGMDADEAKVLAGVSCESCHGAGGDYRARHGDATDRLKARGETTERRVLVEAGQNFDYERACAGCHLNHSGSPSSGAKPPHSPFTPSLDPKYQFDFQRLVRQAGNRNPVHAHFKLRGVFKGEPTPPIRAELQSMALEAEE